MCVAAVAIPYIMAAMAGASAYMQADAAKKSANFQSQVAANNAKVSERLAQDAIERGNLEQQATRRKNAQLMGAQRATLAARGIDISEGSALSILEDTAYFGEVDERTVRANAEREAWGFRVQGVNYQSESELRRSQARSTHPALSGAMAAASAYMGAGGSFGGGGSMMGNASAVAPRWFSGSPNIRNAG